jgi:ethanolamine ammonia-lyase large subunit
MNEEIRTLTEDEVMDIADILENKVWNYWHDAIMRVIGDDFEEISDESVDALKKELAKAFK